ncbi:MAG: hypothetical protein ACREC0_04520, partial [Methylocella sp.]
MANFKNNDELRAWLRTQPREVAVALAARAALRVLPIVLTAERKGYMRDVVLPVFRATAAAWAAGKYPAHETELAAAAAAYAAYAAAAPAAADAYDAACAADAAYAVFAADAAYTADAAAHAAAVAAHAADALVRDAAAYAAAAAALAVRGDAAHAVDAVAFGFDHLVSVTRAAAAASAASAARAAGSFFWSALSPDATRLEEGATASDIAGSPLWPQGQPVRLRSLWKVLETGLVAEKQDWRVWTDWYADRLAGRVREEKRELAYVRIADELWKQCPAIVNAKIKRRIEE